MHPSVDPSDVLFYEHNPENHWSNEKTTVALWEKTIIPYISCIRAQLNNQVAACIVLGDAFPAHWTDAVRAVAATIPYLSYIGVPDTLTLLFQPLDLGIVAAAKSSVMRRKDDFLEQEVLTAVREKRGGVLSTSKPILRDRSAMWIKETLLDPVICPQHCCRVGFERAGVMCALGYDNITSHSPDIDALLPAPGADLVPCADCSEPSPPAQSVVCSKHLYSDCLDNHTVQCH